ncbi:hypothetical protein GCM10017774_37610 [Lentzea cavernae]|uniref:Uncharacterized protein n=1 Tax=Lentzea cavernae TaxID=2020703 RepID=A0ABQ3ME83_9PSEU|nr:hypothetical protein GCM10017774_37610 [Lentzea cavernae]
MNGLTAEAIGDMWFSLTNEQRSELLSQRRQNQLSEKALGAAPTDQTEELQHAQEVLHGSRP